MRLGGGVFGMCESGLMVEYWLGAEYCGQVIQFPNHMLFERIICACGTESDSSQSSAEFKPWFVLLPSHAMSTDSTRRGQGATRQEEGSQSDLRFATQGRDSAVEFVLRAHH